MSQRCCNNAACSKPIAHDSDTGLCSKCLALVCGWNGTVTTVHPEDRGKAIAGGPDTSGTWSLQDVAAVESRIAKLEAENASLRAEILAIRNRCGKWPDCALRPDYVSPDERLYMEVRSRKAGR